ncbi:hypothetical protein F2P56_036952 [Juglans regia]|uniref:Uncharacterized protein n=1 Tax=Juglans regia TaxID=51240 RepID=A0A833THN0_JUGRE|nr:hypothetical protein F2P56_036952 [Juglans regia]
MILSAWLGYSELVELGTNNVEGIKVVLPEGHNHDDMIRLSPKAFAKMKRLRYFISRGACFSGGVLSYLSNELRVLDWSNCHLPSLPSNFHGEKLVVFKMNEGRIKEINCWKFKNLTVMKFSKCKFLSNILDVSSCSNLERLDIEMCENLVEVHDFVGFLDKLVSLNLYRCLNLKSFPRHLKLRSLRNLELWHCSKLQNFPQIECRMEILSYIQLEGTPIKEWPSSIGYLTPALNLLSLYLDQCIHQLQNQKELCLSDYSIMLKEDERYSSINVCFTGIEHLSIEGSKDLLCLPISIPHLQVLKDLSLLIHTNLAGYLIRLKMLHLTNILTAFN